MKCKVFIQKPYAQLLFGRFLGMLCLMALFAGVPLAYGQGTNLVVNGSFEADPHPGGNGYTSNVTGWSVSGSGILNTSTGPFYTADLGPIPDGIFVYGHQGGGSLSQVISGLNHGANCTLRFHRNLRSATTPMKLTAAMGSQTLWGPVRITATNPFQQQEVSFVYNSAWGNTLTFYFTEPEGDATILLDNVQLLVSYTVTPSVTGGNGGIAPNTPQTVNAGGSVAFTMTPNPGYRVGEILVNGARLDDPALSHTISDIWANQTISVSFSPADWTFDSDGYRDGWAVMSQIDDWNVAGGLLSYNIAAAASDPMWASQILTLPRANYRWLRVIAKNETRCVGSIMFWVDNTIGGFTGGYQHNYAINPHDTQLSEYWVDLHANGRWLDATTITRFRFDFPDSTPDGPPLGNEGTHVDVDRITLLPDGSGPPAPYVTAITRHDPTTGDYTNAAQVTWEVRFSHSMTNVAADDFSFATTGSASASIDSGVRVGPTWYRITADVSGTGTVRLNSITGGSGRDIASQSIDAGYSSGEVYTIDRDGPAVGIGAPSTTLTNSGPVTYTVTYTDDGSGFSGSTLAVGNITLNATGTAAGTLGVSGSGNTRTVTISDITGNGTLGISIAAGTATDVLGNASPSAGPSAVFNVDNTPPTVADVQVHSGLTVDVTYDKPMGAGVTTPGNYTVGGSGKGSLANSPNGVALVSGNTYRLTWLAPNEMFGGGDITITVTNVQDLAGNVVGTPNSGTDTGGAVGDPPEAACNSLTVTLPGPITVNAADIDGGSTDNIGIAARLINGVSSLDFDHEDIGANPVTLRVLDAAGNYDECGTTVTVQKATPTATLAVNNSPVVYDGTAKSATVTVLDSSVPGTATNILAGAAAEQTAAGVYDVTADFEPNDLDNYNTLTGLSAGQFVIDKAPSTITATGAAVYTYTGGAQGPGTAEVTGSEGAVTYIYSGTAPTVYGPSATKPTNAGTFQVVATVAEDANHYGASSAPLAFTIEPPVITITLVDVVKIWDGAAEVALGPDNFAPQGLVPGESLIITQTEGLFDSADIGENIPVSADVDGFIAPGPDTDLANYVLPLSATGFGTITDKIVPTVIWPTATAIVFGEALDQSTLEGGSATDPDTSAPVLGDFAFLDDSIVPAAAGVYNANVTFTPENDALYQSRQTQVPVTVQKAPANVLLDNLTQTYDGSPKHVLATTDPIGLTVVLTYDGAPTAPTNAGSYVVEGVIEDTNYQGSAADTLVIARATPEITTPPTASVIVYGQPLSAASLSGGAASTSGIFAFTNPDLTPEGGIANHSVTFTPADTANYDIVLMDVSVSVAPLVTALGATQVLADIGGSVTFVVEVAGAVGPLDFQWYRITEDKALSPVPDANEPSLTLSSLTMDDALDYQCEVNDTGAGLISWSPIFTLTFGAGLPAASLFGLLMVAALSAITGATALRKKH